MQNNYDNQRADEGVTYAGFWVRLAAYLIDSVIIFFMLLVVRLAMSGVMSVLYGTAVGGNILFSYTLKDIVLYLGQVLYFVLCTRFTGTTPGKRAMNLRVICVDESGELDLFTVLYRETVGRFLCSISICIGYLIIGLDREKRGFHDMLCDTRVVYGKKVKIYPVYPYAPIQPAAGAAGQGGSGGVPPAAGPMRGNQGSPVGTPPTGMMRGNQGSPSGTPPMGMMRGNQGGPAEVLPMGIQRYSYHEGETHTEVKEEKGDSSEI